MRHFLPAATFGAALCLTANLVTPSPVGAEHPSLQGNASLSASPDDCLLPYGIGFATWVCDEAGEGQGDFATLYAVRVNQHGSQVYLGLWSGSRSELTERGSTLVAEHGEADSNCHTYFHVATQTATGVTWNVATSNMRAALRRDGASRFHGFCYSAEPSWADFVIAWAESRESIPYSFALPVPQTSYLYGNMSTFGSAGYTSGRFSGSITTTRMQTYQGARSEWNVSAAIFPVELRNGEIELGTPLHRSDETGRWRWSKPDKDVLVDALGFLSSRRAQKIGGWPVLHVHGSNLRGNCAGVLMLEEDSLTFSSTTHPEHQWSEGLASVREVRKNRYVLSSLNGFHIRLADGRNYNFILVLGDERGVDPAEILVALGVAIGDAQLNAVATLTSPDTDDSGAEETQSSGTEPPLTNHNIAELVEAGIGDDVIITKIRVSRVTFDLGVDGLVELKSRGVSDAVLSVMLESSGR